MSKEQKHAAPVLVPVIADGMMLGVIGAGVMGQTLIRGILSQRADTARENLGGR